MSAAGCKSADGVDLIEVTADAIHYYEGDDYLMLGLSFSGTSTKSGKDVPLFNGRFTGRAETRILGEANIRMEMETPNTLMRYALNDDGDAIPARSTTWVRCEAIH